MKPSLFSKSLFFILLLSTVLFISNKSYGQYLENDRIDLKNHQSFVGKIIEDHKPDYLIIQTEDIGEIKIQYAQIARVFRRANLEESFYKKLGHQYLSVSVGTGHSYGGYGVRFQQRVGRKVGFAYSIGFGLNRIEQSGYIYNNSGSYYHKYHTNTACLSLAAKFYPYKWIYAEAGMYINYIDIRPEGFVMLGYDYAINRWLTINAGIGSVSTKDFIIPSEGVAFDFGLMFRFPTPKDLIPNHPDVKLNYNQINYNTAIDTTGNSSQVRGKYDLIYLINGDVLKGKITKIRYPYYVEIFNEHNQQIAIKYNIIDQVVQSSLGSLNRVSVQLKNRKVNSGLIASHKPEEGINLVKKNSNDTIYIEKEKIWRLMQHSNNLTKEEKLKYKQAKNYFSISAGYGVNYGSPIGLQIQYKHTFKKVGIALHAGGSTAPNWGPVKTSYMFGIKCYLFDYFYSGISYGIVENKLLHASSYYDYANEKYTGFVLMLGMEYFFNQVIGINAAFGGSYAYLKDYDGGEGGYSYIKSCQIIKPRIDIGIMFKFPTKRRIVLNSI